jgi:hypothetical protein
VSRDIQRPISLEVTVPIITLPSLSEQVQQTEANETPEAAEQVCLLSFDPPAQRGSPATPTSQEIARGEASTYTTQAGLFRLFQCTATLISQKNYLLQVLRTSQAKKRKLASPGSIPPDPTEQLAFSLEYRYHEPDMPYSEQKVDIQPGSMHVVIYLDEENIPDGYRVDGVEW